MCINRIERCTSPPFQTPKKRQPSKKLKVQVKGLITRRLLCEEKEGKDMELKNLKLYLENRSILEENEKLRKKADLLHQENIALMHEFQKTVPSFGSLLDHPTPFTQTIVITEKEIK